MAHCCLHKKLGSITLEIPKIWLTLEIQSSNSMKYIISCELGHKRAQREM